MLVGCLFTIGANLLTGATILFAILIVNLVRGENLVIVEGNHYFTHSEVLGFLFVPGWTLDLLYIGALLLLLCPIIWLTLLDIRLLFNKHIKLKYASRANGVLFLSGIVFTVISIITLTRHFNAQSVKTDLLPIENIASDMLEVNLLRLENNKYVREIRVGQQRFKIAENDAKLLQNVVLNIETTAGEQFHLKQRKSSRGRDKTDAEK